MLNDCIELRHYLHQNPELSGNEECTHNTIVGFLKNLKPTTIYENVGGFGIVAVFKKYNAKKTLAFRADIDALPINETTDVPYCSDTKNIAHKCGHDGHSAILLRFAEKISLTPLKYNIVLIFQPEEETGKGAKKIVDTGLLQKLGIDAIFGLHNIPQLPCNTIVIKKDTFAAASCGFVAKLKGRQTHAAHPENGINPGLAVAEIIQLFQNYNLNHCKQNCFGQSTLIYTHIGNIALGTSAGDAEIIFTLRAFSNVAMRQLLDFATDTLQKIGIKYSLKTSYELQEDFPATENNNQLVDCMADIAIQNNYSIHYPSEPFRWSEDFSQYLSVFKGAFFGIGSGENCHELHHPDYNFPDEIIEPAADFLLSIAKELSTNYL